MTSVGKVLCARIVRETCFYYRVAQKSKPLPNYQNVVLNRITTCQ